MKNTARIEKARLQFRDNWKWNQTSEDFRKAIQDNLPKQISVEAVKELREKTQKEIDNIWKYDILEHEQWYYEWLIEWKEDEIKDLDILLSQQQDDTN